jgi:FlaA1/EpsC-like NDP-sugar epimerase
VTSEKSISTLLFSLPRWQKRLIMLATDIVLLPFAVWLSFSLRLGEWQPGLQDGFWLMLAAPLVTLPIFVSVGLYRAIIRFISGAAILAILKGVTISALMLATISLLFDWQGIPRSIYPIYWGVAFLLIGSSRYWVRRYYHAVQHHPNRQSIAIYGAGQSGTQLAIALENSAEYRVVAYLDDNPILHKSVIHGITVYPPLMLPILLDSLDITQVLLAIPSAPPSERRRVLNYLEPLKIHVRSVPNVTELVSGKSAIAELREIEIDELLGRAPVVPNTKLLASCITGKAIMVTGAGGSIGSELCRQIIRLEPTCLVLFEMSEFAVYQIEQELLQLAANERLNVPLIPVLGSVQDRKRVEEVLRQYRIETLYHAAAYKHVPMVEHNPVEGIRNNVFGTLHAAQAAQAAGVERFILISTDKAVRPTNVMGASKRMAELVLQGLAQCSSNTLFGMVRFGNVLGSSGSVVPLFRKQIQMGGPITVTHPDIIRYFMTIPEAAQLVIQAGAMAQGGDVFLLEMGEPVRILDMAKRMIRLSGLDVQDDNNPHGDIRVEFTGLRPGEKLYEELLISDNPEATAHERIFKAHEHAEPWDEMHQALTRLELACQHNDLRQVYALLKQYVHGFNRPGHAVIESLPAPKSKKVTALRSAA